MNLVKEVATHLTIFPVAKQSVNSADGDEEIDFDLENTDDTLEFSKDNSYIPTKIIQKRIRMKEEAILLKNSVTNLGEVLNKYTLGNPRFQLDVKKISVVKFSNELLMNLNLNFRFNDNLFRKMTKTFDETLSYNNVQKEIMRTIVTRKGAFLFEDSNFFEVDKVNLSEYTKLTTLRNSRVLLYWRNLELDNEVIKKIITLGLCFLLEIITYAELYFYISQFIERGSYEITIKYVKNSYVLIGIESPIFQ